jgi:glycosyltransferase involved in cell wall biosynthesis
LSDSTSHEIIYITESNGYGGAEKYLLDLSAEATKFSKKVSIAFPFNPLNLKLRSVLSSRGVKIVDIRQYMAAYPLNFIIAMKFFINNKQAFFHFTLPYPDSCRWLLLAASLLRRNYLITELLVPPDPFKAGLYFSITHRLFRSLKKFSYSRSKKVIVICEAMKDILVNVYSMPEKKIIVIFNGIKLHKSIAECNKEFLLNKFKIKTGHLILTAIGRLADQKGHIFLIHALQNIIRQYPNILLLLVGDGPLKSALEAEIQRMNLSAHVMLLGYREDIEDILAITDIFAFPSLNEGLSYTLLEAMAAGKPIVASNVTGNSEAIEHGETGLLCKKTDHKDLAGKILFLLDHEQKRKEMSKKAIEQISLKFNVEIMTKKTFDLYGN